MKINKKFLQKIIKEEIQKVVEDETLKRDVIACYVRAISASNNNFPDKNEPEKRLYKDLKALGIDPLEALPMLGRNEVPGNFFQNASHMHNAMVRSPLSGGKGKEIMIDAFADFPKVNSDKNKDPDPGFMRVPKTPQARDQLDTRKDRKNLVNESTINLINDVLTNTPTITWANLGLNLLKIFFHLKKINFKEENLSSILKISKGEYARRARIFFEKRKEEIAPLIVQLTEEYPDWKKNSKQKAKFYSSLKSKIQEKFKNDETFRYDFIRYIKGKESIAPSEYIVTKNYDKINKINLSEK